MTKLYEKKQYEIRKTMNHNHFGENQEKKDEIVVVRQAFETGFISSRE